MTSSATEDSEWQVYLLRCADTSLYAGVTRNLATAAGWFRKSAEAGNRHGQCNLATCYYNGDGVTKNLRTARSWYQKSADQNHASAMLKLGTMMVKGEGGERDVKEGVAMWEKAAAAGKEEAQAKLGRLHGFFDNDM